MDAPEKSNTGTGPETAPEHGFEGWRQSVAAHKVTVVRPDGAREEVEAAMVKEVPFTVYLNGSEIVTLLCTGVDLKVLALGFLKSEGLIVERSKLAGVEVDREGKFARVQTAEETALAQSLLGKRTVTSGCGKGSTFYTSLDALRSRKITAPIQIGEGEILRLMKSLHEHSDLYRETRGVHNCGLAAGGEIQVFKSDIGRHNALDMIIGTCFLEGMPTGDKILLTTGRITSEILIKTAKVGIPAVVSLSSATSLAVTLAEELNMTIVGRVRAGAMVIYSGAENVVPKQA